MRSVAGAWAGLLQKRAHNFIESRGAWLGAVRKAVPGPFLFYEPDPFLPFYCSWARSAYDLVIFRVGSDPEPQDGIFSVVSESTVMYAHPDGP